MGTATGRYSFHRPVLVLVDRAMDMATPLHHTWTYQALAHDVLPYNQNRVTMEKNKVYELDHKDEFWVQHRGSPFPQVAEAIQELLEKKRLIDMHCSLATSVLDSIKQRRLDVFFELEEKLMSATPLDRSLMEVLTDPENVSPEDKLRLFLIFYISTPEVSDKEFKEYSDALKEAGCDLNALAYLKRWKSMAAQSSKMVETAAGGQGTTKAVSMFSNLISQSSNFVMAGVKNLVVKKHNLPLTKIVDEIMEQKQGKVNEEFKYLDPKILRGQESGQVPRTKTPFADAVVFVVGGGNYIEHQNLQDYVKTRNAAYGNNSAAIGSQKRVVYGSTQLTNAAQFLGQLARLGAEQ